MPGVLSQRPTLMAERNFIVVLVQDSWHTQFHAQPLVSSFESKGVECEDCWYPSNRVLQSIRLQSTRFADFQEPREEPPSWPDGHTDSAYVEARLRNLVDDEGRNVVVLAHGWGGIPASEACKKDLSLKLRKEAGRPGGVLGILYLTSFPVPVGMSTLGFMNPDAPSTPPPAFQLDESSSLVSCRNPTTALFSPVERKTNSSLIAAAAKAFVPQPLGCHTTTLNYGGYLHVPCGYLLCEQDPLVPVEVQRMLIQSLRDQGVGLKVWTCNAGHEPALTWPNGIRDVVMEFVQRVLDAT